MATLEELAREVIQGKWGNGASRRSNLESNGYDYASVQNVVNQMLGGSYNGGANYEVGGGASQANPLSSLETQISATRNKILDMGDKPTYASEYGDKIKALTASLESGDYFNPETDKTYQQYKSDYTRLGSKAMDDTLGKVAARTGGLASSYALSAAQQTYNNYMDELASKIPELEKLARSRVQSDLSNYQGLENTNYRLYQDKLADYYKNRNALEENLSLLEKQKAEQEAAIAAAAKAAASRSSGGRRSSGGKSSGNSSSGNVSIRNYNDLGGSGWVYVNGTRLSASEVAEGLRNGTYVQRLVNGKYEIDENPLISATRNAVNKLLGR